MYDTTVVLLVATRTILSEQKAWNSFRARNTSVPDNLYAACFPERTRFLLQYTCLSERLTIYKKFAEHVLVGVMVDPEAHFFHPVTIVDVGPRSWGSE